MPESSWMIGLSFHLRLRWDCIWRIPRIIWFMNYKECLYIEVMLMVDIIMHILEIYWMKGIGWIIFKSIGMRKRLTKRKQIKKISIMCNMQLIFKIQKLLKVGITLMTILWCQYLLIKYKNNFKGLRVLTYWFIEIETWNHKNLKMNKSPNI